MTQTVPHTGMTRYRVEFRGSIGVKSPLQGLCIGEKHCNVFEVRYIHSGEIQQHLDRRHNADKNDEDQTFFKRGEEALPVPNRMAYGAV